MSRRSTPERIDAAHREGTRQRLLRTGVLPGRVDELMAGWEASAASQGLPRDGRYWDAGYDWIVAQRPQQRRTHLLPELQEAAAAALDTVLAEPPASEAR